MCMGTWCVINSVKAHSGVEVWSLSVYLFCSEQIKHFVQVKHYSQDCVRGETSQHVDSVTLCLASVAKKKERLFPTNL